MNETEATLDLGEENDGSLSALEVAKQLKSMGYIIPYQRVAILRDPMVTNQGGIYIPHVARQIKRSGTIVGLGLDIETLRDGAEVDDIGLTNFADAVELGQRVAFSKYEALSLGVQLEDRSITLDFLAWRDIYLLIPARQAERDAWAELNYGGFVE